MSHQESSTEKNGVIPAIEKCEESKKKMTIDEHATSASAQKRKEIEQSSRNSAQQEEAVWQPQESLNEISHRLDSQQHFTMDQLGDMLRAICKDPKFVALLDKEAMKNYMQRSRLHKNNKSRLYYDDFRDDEIEDYIDF